MQNFVPPIRAALLIALVGASPQLIAAGATSAEHGGSQQQSLYPSTAHYSGRVVDSKGKALEGTFAMGIIYHDRKGNPLLSETHENVEVIDGQFEVTLGKGLAVATTTTETATAKNVEYHDLQDVFSKQPEVFVEVSIDGQAQTPRFGIQPAGHSLKTRLLATGNPVDDSKPHWKHIDRRSGRTAVQSAILAPAGFDDGSRAGSSPKLGTLAPEINWNPYLAEMTGPGVTRALKDLPTLDINARPKFNVREVNPPRHENLYDDQGNRFGTAVPQIVDPLADFSSSPEGGANPGIAVEFSGVGNVNGVAPPDTEGAVGPNHYVQVVNLAFAIYDKSGTLLTGPSNTNTIWTGSGLTRCENNNNGDAIFLYDREADRWLLSQFAPFSNNTVCFAVSQTPDPTGAYFAYEVSTPRFPDYYKLGTWTASGNNAYFMGTNSGTQGAYDVFALDRENMLQGMVARPMQIFQNYRNLLMPADVDGPNQPPAGSPGILYSFAKAGEPYFFNPAESSLDIYEFDVDWDTPANTTLTLAQQLTPSQGGFADFNWTICGFFMQNCLPQPGTGNTLDSASWWPMQRLQYRNFTAADVRGDANEALVGTWTVDVDPGGDRAGIRWFELRRSGADWSIAQQGTYSPDADHRWMPSISMDKVGNIAVAYSKVNGSDVEPSLYYTTWQLGDTPGVMRPESVLIAGSGVQTGTARWGDYASMDVDPVNDCTFWFTSEYMASTGGAPWVTRVASFTAPSCQNDIYEDGFENP